LSENCSLLINWYYKGLDAWQQEKLMLEFQHISAKASEKFGRADRIYDRIDIGDARPIRYPLMGSH
jgi:hypothetical protein